MVTMGLLVLPLLIRTKLQMDMSTSFRAATEQQSVKAKINHDLITALLGADIPFEKMDNPAMREFFRKHVKNGGAIGTVTYMRSKLSEVHDQHKTRLANSLAQYKTFSIVADETTDTVGRCMLNTLLIPDLSGNLSGSGHIGLKPLRLNIAVLEATNSATVGAHVIRALAINNIAFIAVTAFISDNVPYMKKAFREILKPVLVNAVHFTCWAHIMNLIGDEFRISFTDVDKFCTKMKAIFQFSGQKKSKYLEYMTEHGRTNIKLPHQPVVTRWNNWLEAVQQHSECANLHPGLIYHMITECGPTADLKTLQDMLQPVKRKILFLQSKYRSCVSL